MWFINESSPLPQPPPPPPIRINKGSPDLCGPAGERPCLAEDVSRDDGLLYREEDGYASRQPSFSIGGLQAAALPPLDLQPAICGTRGVGDGVQCAGGDHRPHPAPPAGAKACGRAESAGQATIGGDDAGAGGAHIRLGEVDRQLQAEARVRQGDLDVLPCGRGNGSPRAQECEAGRDRNGGRGQGQGAANRIDGRDDDGRGGGPLL